VGAPRLGRAYVFRRSSTGHWRQHQTLMASELGTGGGGFGAAVAIDRAMIIVGAPNVARDDPSEPEGAAYGFIADRGVYVETFKLEPDRGVFFGRQVAMFNRRVVVGAQLGISSDGQLNGVAAFTYTREGSSVIPRGVALAFFASTSLSLANQRLLVGIPCDSGAPGFCTGFGRVVLYKLNVFE
jgi:FG-GAP repeat